MNTVCRLFLETSYRTPLTSLILTHKKQNNEQKHLFSNQKSANYCISPVFNQFICKRQDRL